MRAIRLITSAILCLVIHFAVCGKVHDEAAAVSVPDTIRKHAIRDTIQKPHMMLDEFVVSQKLVRHDGTGDSYVVTKGMLDNVHDAGELLGKLDGVYYNPLSRELAYLGSQKVMILVDSLQRDQDYIKRLNPKRFARITVVNQPSGLYSGYDAVINLVTKKAYTGYDGAVLTEMVIRPENPRGTDRISGLRDVAEITYTRDKWNIAFSGSYKRINQWTEKWYDIEYPLNGFVQKVERGKTGQPNRQVVNDYGDASLWVDYKISDRHSLSAGFGITPAYAKVAEDAGLWSGQKDGALSFTRQKSADRMRGMITLSPSLQYRGRIGRWSLDAALQYSNDAFERLWSVERDGFGLHNDRRVRTQYFWAGLVASRRLSDKIHLSLSNATTATGYNEHDLHSKKELSSSSDVRDKLTAGIQYSISDHVSSGLSVGADIYHSESNGNSMTRLSPLIDANLMAYVNKLIFRLNYSSSVIYPTLAYVQDYGRFTDSLIFHRGNPLLKNSLSHKVNLSVNFFRMFTIGGEYTSRNNAIYEIVEPASGIRPDGIDGYYADYCYRNGHASDWKINLTFNKTVRSMWTFSANVSLRHERAAFNGMSESKTLPEYSWHVIYSNSRCSFNVYASSSLNCGLAVTPQSVGWSRYDTNALSVMKFLNKGKIQMMLMWVTPLHLMRKDYVSMLRSPVLNERMSYSNRVRDNEITFAFVWRFAGGSKTMKYNRRSESVTIY